MSSAVCSTEDLFADNLRVNIATSTDSTRDDYLLQKAVCKEPMVVFVSDSLSDFSTSSVSQQHNATSVEASRDIGVCHIRDIPPKLTVDDLTCSVCKHVFTQRSDLKRHMYIHTGEKPFACKLCSHRTTRLSSLRLHIANKHSECEATTLERN